MSRLLRTIQDAQLLAAKRDGSCLSVEYTHRKNMNWKCRDGHIWWATFDNIRAGRWCPDCAPKSKRMGYGRKSLITMEYVREIAQEHNGKCLSEEYHTVDDSMRWECYRGHKWDMTFGSIRCGHWCHECFILDRRQTGLNKALLIIQNKSGVLVGGEYISQDSPLSVMCAIGHSWDTSANKLAAGHWCRYCSKPGKGVRDQLLPVLSTLYPGNTIQINRRDITWLIGPGGGPMEIDFLITTPIQTIAIEYDGKQHFEAVNWSGDKIVAQKEFEQLQQRDKLKDKLIAAHPNEIQYFVRIPYTVPLTIESISNHLKQNNIPISV